mmetsp:Transcript_26177/g.57329  ORF Transcript_26177/g.57329 Transcript_26177/m.57329 type:complete len:220 (-) Transcript_26177:206-865(-)
MLWSLSVPVASNEPVTSFDPKLTSDGPRSIPSVAHPPAFHDEIHSFLALVEAEAASSSSVGCKAASVAAVRSVAQVKFLAPEAASMARSGTSSVDTIRSRGMRANTSRALIPPSPTTSTPPFPRSSGLGSRKTSFSWRTIPAGRTVFSLTALLLLASAGAGDDQESSSAAARKGITSPLLSMRCCARRHDDDVVVANALQVAAMAATAIKHFTAEWYIF